jgi:hypothetical protein
VSVYADAGVTEPADRAVATAALPSVQVGRLDADEVRRLVDAGRAVVDAQEDYGQPPVADAPTTAVVVPDGAGLGVAAAVALEELSGEPGAPDGAGLTAEQRAARERLRTYVRQVQDAASAAPAEAYEGEGLAVLAEPYGEGSWWRGRRRRSWPGRARPWPPVGARGHRRRGDRGAPGGGVGVRRDAVDRPAGRPCGSRSARCCPTS